MTTNTPEPIRSAPEAVAAFEELQQRAEQDVANEDDVERQCRPSWGPPLIIEGDLLASCVDLEPLELEAAQ